MINACMHESHDRPCLSDNLAFPHNCCAPSMAVEPTGTHNKAIDAASVLTHPPNVGRTWRRRRYPGPTRAVAAAKGSSGGRRRPDPLTAGLPPRLRRPMMSRRRSIRFPASRPRSHRCRSGCFPPWPSDTVGFLAGPPVASLSAAAHVRDLLAGPSNGTPVCGCGDGDGEAGRPSNKVSVGNVQGFLYCRPRLEKEKEKAGTYDRSVSDVLRGCAVADSPWNSTYGDLTLTYQSEVKPGLRHSAWGLQ